MNVLLISCYERGHQPFSLASAAAHLSDRGHKVRCLDLAVEELDPDRVRRAGLVAISIPMHTAIRIGVEAGRRVRDLNPDGHLAYFGLYASLNEDDLLETTADSVIGGEFETPLADQADALAAGNGGRPEGVSLVRLRDEPNLSRQSFLAPVREGLPPLERYAHLVLPGGETRRVRRGQPGLRPAPGRRGRAGRAGMRLRALGRGDDRRRHPGAPGRRVRPPDSIRHS